MTSVLIGTSGYDYPGWKGVLYPFDLPRKAFLPHYSTEFETLELNFSYYRIPTPRQMEEMISRTGGRLDISLKAHRTLTHDIDPHGWKADALQFRRALEPLERAERLGAVLLQFPYGFHYEPDRRIYLALLLKELAGLPLAVEFRQAEWQSTRVYDTLREMHVTLCLVDMPDLPGLPQAVEVVTSDMVYLRFHGRNAEQWWGTDGADRYDYLYSDQELNGWVMRIRCLYEQVASMRIYFNNPSWGKAVCNARTLKSLLHS